MKMKQKRMIVLFFLVIFIIIGAYKIFLPNHYFYVDFNSVDPIKKGVRVKLEDYTIGKVTNFELISHKKSRVKVVIDNKFSKLLPKNTIFVLKKENLIVGNEILEAIVLNEGEPAPQGFVFKGYSSNFSYQIANVLKEINDLLNSEEWRNLISQLKDYSENLANELLLIIKDLNNLRPSGPEELKKWYNENHDKLPEQLKNEIDKILDKFNQ